jgi:hypothetical protein
MLKFNPTKHRDALAEPEGEIDNAEDFDVHASLKILAKDGMAVLHERFPGWRWAIQINEFGRMMNLFNLDLHDTWGYTIRIMEIEHDPSRKIFVKAGTEILERFGMRAAGIDYAALSAMKRDPRGRGIPYLTDLDHAAARKAKRKRKIDEAISAGRIRINPLTKAIEVGII